MTNLTIINPNNTDEQNKILCQRLYESKDERLSDFLRDMCHWDFRNQVECISYIRKTVLLTFGYDWFTTYVDSRQHIVPVSEFSKCVCVKTVYVEETDYDEDFLIAISKFPNVESVYFVECNDVDLMPLTAWKNLINMSINCYSGDNINFITEFKKLRRLSLVGSKYVFPFDEMTYLRRLFISNGIYTLNNISNPNAFDDLQIILECDNGDGVSIEEYDYELLHRFADYEKTEDAGGNEFIIVYTKKGDKYWGDGNRGGLFNTEYGNSDVEDYE